MNRVAIFIGKIFFFIAAIIFFMFGIQSCKKKYVTPVITATLNGSYAFSADVTATYAYGQIRLIATQTGSPIKDIEIDVTAASTGTYSLNSANGINTGLYIEGPNTSNLIKYETDASHTGSVTFTKMDLTKQLMSGTFSYNALEFSPTVGTASVVITNGSFTNVPW